MKVSEASGPALDWMVAKCEGLQPMQHFTYAKGHHIVPHPYYEGYDFGFTPSTDWAQGGPIIEREGITTAFCSGDLGEPRTYWIATTETQSWEYGYGPYHEQDDVKSLCIRKPDVVKGPTPLIAAMRCYVASKLGEEVEVPEGL